MLPENELAKISKRNISFKNVIKNLEAQNITRLNLT